LHLIIDRLAPPSGGVPTSSSRCRHGLAAVLLAGGIAVAPLARRAVDRRARDLDAVVLRRPSGGGALMILFALPQL